MARSRLCRVCKAFHPLEDAWPLDCLGHFGERPALAPFVRPDGMDPIQSMVSGQFFDSRSAYYREVRAAGCEIVGNDVNGFGPRPGYQPGDVAADIKRSIQELTSGR